MSKINTRITHDICLTQLMPMLPAYRNQSNDLQRRSIDWLLYDANVIHTSEKISASQSRFLHVYQL